MLLAHLVKTEDDIEIEQARTDFKNLLFAQAFLNQGGDRELYSKLYPEDFGLTAEEEQDLNFMIPSTPSELEALMTEMRSTGWDK